MEYKLLINNQPQESELSKQLPIVSPWDNQQLGTVHAASSFQANAAVSSAHNAFSSWRLTTLAQRIELMQKIVKNLHEHSQELGDLLSKEIGKNAKDAKSEIDRSIEFISLCIAAVLHMKGEVFRGDSSSKYALHQKTGLYERLPLGVILAIAPFNYPINLSITKIAPALLSGNTVVLKPPTQGSLTSYAFYQHFIDSGLPEGVLNVVTGESADIGDSLTTNELVKLIAFTGSTNVGKHIAKVSLGVPLLMELGGKDVAIVTTNADLKKASAQIVEGAFSYAGQRCTAQKLVLVEKAVADELQSLLIGKMSELEINPMINSGAADYVQELIDDAKQKGAVAVVEGSRENNLLQPTLLDQVNNSMRIFHEEQFGPVLPIVRVDNEDEALNLANSLAYGLQASVYTKDLEQAFRIADKLEVGTVQINAKPDRGPDNFPFGGVKDSGQFMQGTLETMQLMTRGKLTVINRFEH